jgi:hypothetical protein
MIVRSKIKKSELKNQNEPDIDPFGFKLSTFKVMLFIELL